MKTKFTRNGREVMIFGGMRNFEYGSEESVQESKKGGEREASVILSSPEKSRNHKSVEGISMLASTELEDKEGNFIWVACVISGEDHEVGNFL